MLPIVPTRPTPCSIAPNTILRLLIGFPPSYSVLLVFMVPVRLYLSITIRRLFLPVKQQNGGNIMISSFDFGKCPVTGNYAISFRKIFQLF